MVKTYIHANSHSTPSPPPAPPNKSLQFYNKNFPETAKIAPPLPPPPKNKTLIIVHMHRNLPFLPPHPLFQASKSETNPPPQKRVNSVVEL